jgi:hypothetical protein
MSLGEMKNTHSLMLRPFSVLMLVAALTPGAAGAGIVDWEDGTWTFGGTDYTGWQTPGSSTYSPASPYTGTTAGGLVTVKWSTVGSAVGFHASLGGNQPQVRTDFNGGGTDGALSVAASADNGNSGGLTNYVQLTVEFALPVDLGSFVIGDVDRSGGSSWQDFVGVEGSLGGSSVTPSYITSTTNTAATFAGLNGVKGTGSAPNDGATGNVIADFGGDIDTFTFYFMQGPDVSGNSQHGVWLPDFSFTEVPEPGTLFLYGVGFTAIGLLRRKARKTTAR